LVFDDTEWAAIAWSIGIIAVVIAVFFFVCCTLITHELYGEPERKDEVREGVA